MLAVKGHMENARAPRPHESVTGAAQGRRPRERKGNGGDGGGRPSHPAVRQGRRGLRASVAGAPAGRAAAGAPAGRAAPAPQHLLMPQRVAQNARQQWAEAYAVVGHKVPDTCANAPGTGV